MLPQPDGRNRHTPQMYHLRGSYPGCRATEEEHVSQAGEREACAEGKHLPRKEYQLRQVKKQAEGRGGHGRHSRQRARQGQRHRGTEVHSMVGDTANDSAGGTWPGRVRSWSWREASRLSNTKRFSFFQISPRDDVEDRSIRDKIESNTLGEKDEGLS